MNFRHLIFPPLFICPGMSGKKHLDTIDWCTLFHDFNRPTFSRVNKEKALGWGEKAINKSRCETFKSNLATENVCVVWRIQEKLSNLFFVAVELVERFVLYTFLLLFLLIMWKGIYMHDDSTLAFSSSPWEWTYKRFWIYLLYPQHFAIDIHATVLAPTPAPIASHFLLFLSLHSLSSPTLCWTLLTVSFGLYGLSRGVHIQLSCSSRELVAHTSSYTAAAWVVGKSMLNFSWKCSQFPYDTFACTAHGPTTMFVRNNFLNSSHFCSVGCVHRNILIGLNPSPFSSSSLYVRAPPLNFRSRAHTDTPSVGRELREKFRFSASACCVLT